MTFESKDLEESEMDIDLSSSNGMNAANAEVSLQAAESSSANEEQTTQDDVSNTNIVQGNNSGDDNDVMSIDVIKPTAATATAVSNPTEEKANAESTAAVNPSTANTSDACKRALSPPENENDAPTKKSKIESSDQSLGNENNATTSHIDVVQTEPSSNSNDLPDAAPLAKTGYEDMEPSIAKLIQDKLEAINEVVPLKPLSLRDLGMIDCLRSTIEN